MENFTPVSAFLGGTLIGLSATLLFWLNGRIAGVSGIVGGLLTARGDDVGWRVVFAVGILLGTLGFRAASGDAVSPTMVASVPALAFAGLLVGYGTRLGSGCTSGHGVCGLARLSVRSLVATLTFMLSGFVAVFLVRHVLGGL
jgi:hypothetical protein